MLAGTCATAITAYYLVASYLRSHRSDRTENVRVSAETILLFGLAVSCAVFGSWEAGRFSKHGSRLDRGRRRDRPACPVAGHGDRLEIRAATGRHGDEHLRHARAHLCSRFCHAPADEPIGCVIYALDAKTGEEIWKFPNAKMLEKNPDFKMKPAFSAPVYAEGRLYFGEGLHQHADSRLFCLDAATGDLLWEYQTESHTESTPVVAEGKVVFGAGYHGIHCLDAVKGPVDNQPLWRFPKDAQGRATELLHVDANPVIADGCVYAGSGYKPEYVKDEGKINTVFCLDLNTGEPKWQQRVEDSVYGSALVKDGRVYFGTGNSTYSRTNRIQTTRHPLSRRRDGRRNLVSAASRKCARATCCRPLSTLRGLRGWKGIRAGLAHRHSQLDAARSTPLFMPLQ